MLHKYSRKEFRAWLFVQDSRAYISPRDCSLCPIAVFMGYNEQIGPNMQAMNDDASLVWAIDHYPWNTLTAGQIINMIDRLGESDI